MVFVYMPAVDGGQAYVLKVLRVKWLSAVGLSGVSPEERNTRQGLLSF